MNFCDNCGRDFTNRLCPRCGMPPSGSSSTRDDVLDDMHQEAKDAERHSHVSVPDATLDTMIERASTPTLASLLKRGVESGLITPTREYAAGDVRP